jgi:hypothetical protein
MYRLVWSFSLVPGVEYLAVENGLRVEDLLRTKLVLRVCNKVLSQFTHRCCYEADETKGEWLHTQWDPDQTWVQVHVAYFQETSATLYAILVVLCSCRVICVYATAPPGNHATKPAATGLRLRWPCLSIPICKAVALFFICIFRLLSSSNLYYLTFSDLPPFYSIQFYD